MHGRFAVIWTRVVNTKLVQLFSPALLENSSICRRTDVTITFASRVSTLFKFMFNEPYDDAACNHVDNLRQ